jgi:hypothetical protein
LPTYLLGKVKQNQITASTANIALEAINPKRLAPPKLRI